MLLLVAAAPGSGEAPTPPITTATTAEERIVVVGSRVAEPLAELPHAATVLQGDEVVGGRPTLQLGEALSQVPGVFVTSRENFAQDTRVSIRGFGARSAFGIRGLRVLLDGIPLTLPDGQSQVDSIDPANLGRIEVLRGSAGALYGNAAGGILVLRTRGPEAPIEARVRSLAGTFGTEKLALSAGARFDDESQVTLFASRTQTDGWRAQSAAEQWVAQVVATHRFSELVRVSLVGHAVDAPRADDPGGLTLAQFREAPRSAAATNVRFGTGEVVTQLQAGARAELDWSGSQRTDLSLHVGFRDFESAVPFRIVAFERTFFGGLLLHRWTQDDWLAGHRLSVGLEIQGQVDQRTNEGNEGGLRDGVLQLDQEERVTSYGLFVQEKLSLMDGLDLLASGRYDRVDFSVTDRLLDDGDASGSRMFDQLTVQGGISWQLLGRLGVFANVAQSYETPTTTELSNPDGGLLRDIDAQRATSYELGARTRGDRYRFEASVFYIDLYDELVSAEDAMGRDVFTNAGRSRRYGAEGLLSWVPHPGWELRAVYSGLSATYADRGRDGNRLPGLPEHRVFTRVRFDDGQWFTATELEWVGPRFADDANQVEAPAHSLAHVRAGARIGFGASWLGILSIGVRNLFDVRYVDNVRPNAFGGRALEPGPPLAVFGRLELRYREP